MNKSSLPEYRAWKAMKARCYAPSSQGTSYQRSGIKVCPEWRNDFDKFLSDMGPKPSSRHSLDRIDNARGYSRENCRWALQITQCGNRGDFNKLFSYAGETYHLKDWSRRLGIKYTTLHQRIFRHGLPFEQAIQPDPFGRLIEIDGKRLTISSWCKALGRKRSTVVNRIHDGWDKYRAILTPTLEQS